MGTDILEQDDTKFIAIESFFLWIILLNEICMHNFLFNYFNGIPGKKKKRIEVHIRRK